MKPEEVWDELVESAVSQANMPNSLRKTRCAKLRLRSKPSPHYLMAKARNVGLIPPPLREALRALVAGSAPWPLFLWGDVGTGKTCSALALLDLAGGWYFTATDLCEMLIDCLKGRIQYPSGHTMHPSNLWEELEGSSLVVLDEVGARSEISDHHYESVKRLVDVREARPLIVISNLDLDALVPIFDERLASRLASGTVLRLSGDDMRLKR